MVKSAETGNPIYEVRGTDLADWRQDPNHQLADRSGYGPGSGLAERQGHYQQPSL